MKLYLTEIEMNGKLEPVGIFSKRTRALGVVGKRVGLISELEVDKHYKKGIGIASHEHLNENAPVGT